MQIETNFKAINPNIHLRFKLIFFKLVLLFYLYTLVALFLPFNITVVFFFKNGPCLPIEFLRNWWKIFQTKFIQFREGNIL